MRRLSIAVAAVAALVLGATGAQAITWGQPDEEGHPHVVTLLFVQDGVGYYSCTGTLLSPTLVLTAGHCTEGGQDLPNEETWVSNHPEPIWDYEYDGIEDYLANSAHWVQGDAIPHPQYDNFSAFPDTYDIGLVELSAPIVTEVYGQLPELGFLDPLARAKGAPSNRQVRIVGYGQQGTIPAFLQNDYVRYVGTSTILGVNASVYQGSQTVQLSNNPGKGTGSGGTCFGDSGGPAFWIDPVTGDETTIVVAITSYGITGQCAGIDFSFRTDIKVAQDFVGPYLDPDYVNANP